MLISKISIVTGGVLSLIMVLFHTRFYKLFKWREEFESISLKNRKILYTIHFALILLFILFVIISFVYLDEMSRCSGIAFGINLSYSLFWLWRAVWQIVYFKPGKSKLSYILTTVFVLLSAAYFIPVLIKVTGFV